MEDDFIISKPTDPVLLALVDQYFFVDVPVDQFIAHPEYVLPFPRITFGFFFDHPFLVTNHDLEESKTVNMVISRISSQKISVLPLTDRIKILGAHVKPYALAYLTQRPINELPWLIDTRALFGEVAREFEAQLTQQLTPNQMFEMVENVFLNALIDRNLEVITKAVQIIERQGGDVRLQELAERMSLSDRTIRDHFHRYIGCAPKTFIQLVQLRNTVRDMNFSDDRLTDVTYRNLYFDQPHFINSLKKITGKSPKVLKKEMPNFRFLQF